MRAKEKVLSLQENSELETQKKEQDKFSVLLIQFKATKMSLSTSTRLDLFTCYHI